MPTKRLIMADQDRHRNRQQNPIPQPLAPILRVRSITSLLRLQRTSNPFDARGEHQDEAPLSSNVLRLLVTGRQVRWDVFERRLASYPDEARELDGDGKSILYHAVGPTVQNEPPLHVVQALIQAYPEAVWMGIDTNRSPLFAACQRRVSYPILQLLVNERPSIQGDERAFLEFWNSYSRVFGGDSGLVQFCSDIHHGRESSSIVVRLYHLLRYCTCPQQQCQPFDGSHSVARDSYDHDLLQTVLHLFPDQLSQPDQEGNLPLHVMAASSYRFTISCAKRSLQTLVDADAHALQVLNRNGDLPLHLAVQSGCMDLDLFLEKYPESVSLPNGDGLLPWQLAAISDKDTHNIGRSAATCINRIYQLIRPDPRVLLPSKYRRIQLTSHGRPLSTSLAPTIQIDDDWDIPLTVTLATGWSDELWRTIQAVGEIRNEHTWKSLMDLLRYKVSSQSLNRNRATWYAVHAAASLHFGPVGLLQLMVQSNGGTNVVDELGWTPLHHLVSVGNAELLISGWIPKDGDDNEELDDLPCLERLRWLLFVAPELVRQHDRCHRFPLHVAVLSGFPWRGLKLLCDRWPEALVHRETQHFLPLAILPAISTNTTLDTVYRLLLACPQVLNHHVTHK